MSIFVGISMSENSKINNAKRPNHWRSPTVMAVIDVILINVAFVLAYAVRYTYQIGGTVEMTDYITLSGLLPLQVTMTIVVMAVLISQGALSSEARHAARGSDRHDRWRNPARNDDRALCLPYLPPAPAFSAPLCICLDSLGRSAGGGPRHRIRRTAPGSDAAGSGWSGCSSWARDRWDVRSCRTSWPSPELGYQLVGFVDDDPAKQEDIGRAVALGSTDNVSDVVDEKRIDQVIITLPWMSHSKVLDIMAHCQNRQVSFRIVPDLFQLSLSQVDIDDLNGIPLIGVKTSTISAASLALKRGIDILGSGIILVVLSPFLALVALIVRLDSPGPAFFRQTRVGRGGKEFTVYKFRTMRVGADQELPALADLNEVKGITFKIREDPRRTRVGTVLRRWSIDEFPQFYNVLRGDMSMVGPRPPLPSEVAKYEDWHMKRLEVSPGITGLWQVMGRSDLPFAEMVMMDIYYIENWSLALDIRMLLQTIPTVLSGKGAY